ncbi:putative sphingoid long-chain base transporter RSB1 [Colletotrichum karsti]|uniref:Sphingoid long-chain base transporter RSB1 n=1 Tax=Colletotrichum karsti TaxID=1095194 RepID=A0A9P6IB11_9PEZI|nr:putative sphingoid long-chain base transporter RSB1 [Colletotrichum karsti]KAF9879204.1 putative sphingoid long-chain base transporter RSB1 [Colletotrichum karsti]
MSSSLCTLTTCDPSESPYGYRPSQAPSAVFITVASACLIANAAIAARTKQAKQKQEHVATPFTIIITLACVLEIVGWADRLAGWREPWAVYPFLQGKALLTMAPVFVTSSIYVCLAPMIRILGTEHSILKPQLYSAILLPLDGLALILQIAGLAVGFKDVPLVLTSKESYAPNNTGAKIVMAGLVLQLATLVIAGLLLASVLVRAAVSYRKYGYTTFHRDVGYVPLPRRFRIFATAVPSAMVVLFGRLCFRVAEYAEGFRGGLATGDEGLFVGLDGLLVAYAIVVLVVCHPALFLRDGKFVSRIEAEPFVGIDGPGGSMRENEAGLEELRKVYQAHTEEEERLSRFER